MALAAAGRASFVGSAGNTDRGGAFRSRDGGNRWEAALLLLVLIERRVAPARGAEYWPPDHMLGVGGGDATEVVGYGDRVLEDLLGLEVAQVDHRHAGVR
jgi:hypothetical protein